VTKKKRAPAEVQKLVTEPPARLFGGEFTTTVTKSIKKMTTIPTTKTTTKATTIKKITASKKLASD